jgi:hypothetical protein
MFRVITFSGNNKDFGEHLQIIETLLELRPDITLGEMRKVMNS